MCERRNTMVCCFGPMDPRLAAYDVHEWIYWTLQVREDSLIMMQIDNQQKRVYIKFTEQCYVDDILQRTNATVEYKHNTGEITQVRLEMGTRRVRITNLPHEMPSSVIRTALTPYGTVQTITEETCSNSVRFKIYNGISTIVLSLNP
jgi:hypothetical protein